MSEYWAQTMRTLNPPPRQPQPVGQELAHVGRSLDFALGGPIGMAVGAGGGGKGGKSLLDLVREAVSHPDWRQGMKLLHDAISPSQPPHIRQLLNQEASRIYFHNNPIPGHTPMPLPQFTAEGKLISPAASAAPAGEDAFKSVVGRSVAADNDFFQQAKAQWLSANPGKDPTSAISDIARLATDLKLKGAK